jgi:hypothetical protein
MFYAAAMVIEQVDSRSKALEIALRIAPMSRMSLPELLEALTEHLDEPCEDAPSSAAGDAQSTAPSGAPTVVRVRR